MLFFISEFNFCKIRCKNKKHYIFKHVTKLRISEFHFVSISELSS